MAAPASRLRGLMISVTALDIELPLNVKTVHAPNVATPNGFVARLNWLKVYLIKLAEPVSLVEVVVCVGNGGIVIVVVVVFRDRITLPSETLPFCANVDKSVLDGPPGSEQTDPESAIGIVTILLTMLPIWTATGTWQPVMPEGMTKLI